MKRFTLPRTGIAAAASVLSLALATGCSDSGSDSGDGDKATGGKESTAAAKVLSSSELEKAIVATGDVDGFEVTSATDSEPFASSKEKVKVVDEKCAPIAYVLTGFAPGDSEAAYLNRQVTCGHRRNRAQRDLLGQPGGLVGFDHRRPQQHNDDRLALLVRG